MKSNRNSGDRGCGYLILIVLAIVFIVNLWNPNKEMTGGVKGGFVEDEIFSKDNPQKIYSGVLSYVLQLQQDGNFHTQGSNKQEMF